MQKKPKTNVDKRNPHERSRSHFIRTYVSREQLENILERNLSIIYRYAFAYHDKDVKEDGSSKEPHFHVWLKFKEKRSYSNVERLFFALDNKGQVINCHDEICVSDIVAQRYLIHIDNRDKAQYDEQDVVCYNLNYNTCLDYRQSRSFEDNTCYNILQDMLDRVPTMELVRRYGKDFLYHINHYLTAVERIRNEDLATKIRLDAYVEKYSGHYGVIDFADGQVVEFKNGTKVF